MFRSNWEPFQEIVQITSDIALLPVLNSISSLFTTWLISQELANPIALNPHMHTRFSWADLNFCEGQTEEFWFWNTPESFTTLSITLHTLSKPVG